MSRGLTGEGALVILGLGVQDEGPAFVFPPGSSGGISEGSWKDGRVVPALGLSTGGFAAWPEGTLPGVPGPARRAVLLKRWTKTL